MRWAWDKLLYLIYGWAFFSVLWAIPLSRDIMEMYLRALWLAWV